MPAAEEQFRDTVVARLQARRWQHRQCSMARSGSLSFRDALLNAIARRKRLHGGMQARLSAVHTKAFRQRMGWPATELRIEGIRAPSRATVLSSFGDRFILKLFRKVEPGINPDIEISDFLTAAGLRIRRHSPAISSIRPDDGERMQLGILQASSRTEGDAWNYTLDAFSRYFEAALASTELPSAPAGRPASNAADGTGALPPLWTDLTRRVSGIGAAAWRQQRLRCTRR